MTNFKHSVIHIYLFVLALSILSINSVEAAKLHAIIVADSMWEHELESNSDLMSREAKRIAACTGMKLNALTFKKAQVTIKNILKHISQLNVESDDMILLYFSLHGSRGENKLNQWPNLLFTLDKAFKRGNGALDFASIFELAKSKNPRFILAIADSCNSLEPPNSLKIKKKKRKPTKEKDIPADSCLSPSNPFDKVTLSKKERSILYETIDEEEIEAYRHLFLSLKGSIMISSSSPGENAIQTFAGGVYTIKFLEVLETYTTWVDQVNWNMLLEAATMRTKQYLISQGNVPYNPQYVIDLHD